MNEEGLRAVLVKALTDVAPEVQEERIDPDADLAEQLEIDSMDLLNVVVSIHEQTGIDVPERDYGKLRTLNAAVAYLLAAQEAGGGTGAGGTGAAS